MTPFQKSALTIAIDWMTAEPTDLAAWAAQGRRVRVMLEAALDAQEPEPVDLTMTDDEREQWRQAADREFFLEHEKARGRRRIVAVMAGNSSEWREFNRQHPESLNVFCNRWPEFAGIDFDDAVVTGTFHGRRDASEIMERVVCQTKRAQR